MGIQEDLKLGLRNGPLVASKLLAVTEQNQGWNALNLVGITGLRIAIHLELAHCQRS